MKIACNELYNFAKDFAKNVNLAGELRFFQRDDTFYRKNKKVSPEWLTMLYQL